MAAKLKHEGAAPKNGSVVAYTQTCPVSAPGGGPFVAAKFSKLSTHTLTFGSSEAQTFTSAGGDSAIAAEYDPVVLATESEKACHTTKAVTEPNTANYTMVSPGFTLLGRPTITATIKTHRALRRDRRTSVGRPPERRTTADQPIDLQAHRKSERNDHNPAKRQRLRIARGTP